MKIVLIRPNMGDYRATDALPPLAIGILAARSGRHSIVFYDDRVEAIPASLDADLVALSVETFTARRAYRLASRFRREGKRVVMGGCHPTFLPEEALEHADAIVCGDAEGVWEDLLADAEHGRLGRIYRNDNRSPLAGQRLDRSIFAGKRYAPVELAQYGRGCRFTCDFCSIHRFYANGTRTRPVDELARELEGLNRKRLLFFVDDNLFAGKRELDALLSAIKPLRLRWSCQISIDAARDPLLLDRLAESGCRYVLIGFESLEAANLEQMKKPWNRAAGGYLALARALHQRGIGIYGTFVCGYDHDTPETVQRSLDFAQEACLEMANFNPLTPMPGSGLYQRLQEEGRLLSPRWWLEPDWRYGAPIFNPRRMSAQQLAESCFSAKKAFYSWASIARRALGGNSSERSWRDTMNVLLFNLVSRREIYRKQGRALGV